MNTDIENINSRLRALILKQREEYALETLEIIEQHLIQKLPAHEVQKYMENARKIVFKK